MKDASHPQASTPPNKPAPDAAALQQPHNGLPPQSVVCPFCRSTDTELLSLFGAQLSTVQYYCRACRTPFEYMKQDDE
ncbi:MAG TPA: hypothetical protein VF116_19090 [Ktedonobacterales bacterium]